MTKPCKAFGCAGLVTSKAQLGYCDDHAGQRTKSNWQKRSDEPGSTAKRGYGTEWKKLRVVILKRDKYLCQECKRNGLVKRGNHVDHVISKALGGTDEPSNLQVLCESCHMTKTGRETH